MRARFWGTRGSIPSPGPDTVRYGGNTPCVEVRLSDNTLIILDAGTGIRPLGDVLAASRSPVQAFIAITHPHWDHIQGFPFFQPLFAEGNEITIAGPETDELSLRQVLSEVMNKRYFPVKLEELRAQISFKAMGENTVPVSGGLVTSSYVCHPFLTLGYRIEERGKSLVYISDNEPFRKSDPAVASAVAPEVTDRYRNEEGDDDRYLVSFARHAGILIHDATYTPEEYRVHQGWGHSDYLYAMNIAHKAEVDRLILFHHHHNHNDGEIDRILEECRLVIRDRGYGFRCDAAFEGMVVEL
ncbi:MAG: MBL fold metallo-hydrolase [Ignavibacteria bacterium]|nr:MBL fold metallo-hydrolase [Ignavibacteria bacterium]